MAKDPIKPLSKKPSARRASKVRVGSGSLLDQLISLLQTRTVAWGILIPIMFGLVAGLITLWARDQPLLAPGQVASETKTVRIGFRVEDVEATRSAREQARQRATPIFTADDAHVRELRASLENLPRTLAGVENLEQVDEGIRKQFRLSPDALAAVQSQVVDGSPSPQWLDRVDRFFTLLRTHPILDQQTWQRISQGLSTHLELRSPDRGTIVVQRDKALNAEADDDLRATLTGLAAQAGFDEPIRSMIVNRIALDARPTYRLDTAATSDAQDRAAAAVKPLVNEWPVGTPIFTRGDVLTPAQIDLWKAELAHYRAQAPRWQLWISRLILIGSTMTIAAGAALYAWLFCPRLRKKVSRMAWIAGLLALALLIASVATVSEPWALTVTAVAPTVFVAAILVIAYEQRMALAFSCLHAMLVSIALDQPIGMFGLILVGAGVAVWQLREIRTRNTLIRMGILTGIALALGTILLAAIDRPITETAMRQLIRDAFWAGLGGVGVGAFVLFVLPLIERAFDITTGMTLIELRDPTQPLLKELQQRAPGTYNHSLNVATIAEAAAEAIGANTLLTYAGALYHDIGKMNKPEYFIENQSGGINKHDKLSPAMSLLVIVGHVKDGLEMARQYNLPKSLQRFIEGHHGTTLVKYFYQRARKNAEDAQDEAEMPNELEYRYPGPKPQSREVAILMIADAVESATRTLAEPTPSRIDALVRSIANNRLLDGQFDECDLTLKDLNIIVDSVSKTVASSYHGRIVYPSGEHKTDKPEKTPEPKSATG